MLTVLEKAVAREIVEHDCIASSKVREMLGVTNRVVLTNSNFPNIRGLLYSYMTAFHNAPYRGGKAWVCVIGSKDIVSLKVSLEQAELK